MKSKKLFKDNKRKSCIQCDFSVELSVAKYKKLKIELKYINIILNEKLNHYKGCINIILPFFSPLKNKKT